MTASLLQFPFHQATERYVSRATLTAPHALDAKTKAQLKKPDVPILELNIDAKIHQPIFGLGLLALDGCDMLFFDVWLGNTCRCHVINPGDPDVIAAMVAWGKVGFIRIRITNPEGERHLGRKTFELNPVLKKALRDSAAKPNFIEDFRKSFHVLLRPGTIEAIVAHRSKREPEDVKIGFLATPYSDPELPELHEPNRQYH